MWSTCAAGIEYPVRWSASLVVVSGVWMAGPVALAHTPSPGTSGVEGPAEAALRAMHERRQHSEDELDRRLAALRSVLAMAPLAWGVVVLFVVDRSRVLLDTMPTRERIAFPIEMAVGLAFLSPLLRPHRLTFVRRDRIVLH